MAIIFESSEAQSPDALTTFVNQVPFPTDNLLSQILPDRFFVKRKIEVNAFTRVQRVAKYRAFDGRPLPSERDTISSNTFSLPPLTSHFTVGELESLQINEALTAGTELSGLTSQIYDDVTNGATEIYNRAEVARGDVLLDGKFTLANENGLTIEADFGLPGSHVVSASTVWSTTASADPIADETSWVNTYTNDNGFAPGGQIMSRQTLNYLLQNAGVRTLAASLSGTPGIVTRNALDTVLDQFGLPPILFVYDTQKDIDGTTTRVLPADKVLFVPPNPADLGYFAWGLSATALKLVQSRQSTITLAGVQRLVAVIDEEGFPYGKRTYVDAVGMPILANPKRLMVADVF